MLGRFSIRADWLVATLTYLHIHLLEQLHIDILLAATLNSFALWHLTYQTDFYMDLTIVAGGAYASAGTSTWLSSSPLRDPTTKQVWEIDNLAGAASTSS